MGIQHHTDTIKIMIRRLSRQGMLHKHIARKLGVRQHVIKSTLDPDYAERQRELRREAHRRANGANRASRYYKRGYWWSPGVEPPTVPYVSCLDGHTSSFYKMEARK